MVFLFFLIRTVIIGIIFFSESRVQGEMQEFWEHEPVG